MAARGGGAYVNGRYVSNPGRGKGGGRGNEKNGRAVGWNGGDGGGEKYERKPGDEDVTLERKFDIDILQPGEGRVGYLFNMKPTRHYDEGGRTLAGLVLYFLQRDGRTFRCTFLYRPYFYVHLAARENFETMKDILAQRFGNDGVDADVVEKEDLDMEDHIIGRKRKLVKLSFGSTESHRSAVRNLMIEIKRNERNEAFDGKKEGMSAMEGIEGLFEHDVEYLNRVCIDNKINCGRWFQVDRNQIATSVDNLLDTQCTVKSLDEMLFKPGLRIFAWDIECTKEPLKFPDSAHDRITMISLMVDGSGFLIVNRTEVSQDIEPLEYTPKPEFEGVFQTYNEPDEAGLLKRFFQLIRETSPHVMVSFNGDFFDYPFVTQRAKVYNLDWSAESGIQKVDRGDYFAGQWIVHMDAFSWVQRDSYLPCGARGLKAVTRNKLKYDPVELDPEDMTPFAKERPQELAAYSVSDAVATYYLYMKYIHDFIFALCTIIPYGPDEVLRKGSGTLCESLLMDQAFVADVVYPNKHVDNPMEYHEGTNRLIEQSTYEGARVECMRVGVYRADIPETFQLEPTAFQVLIHDVKKTVDFFLEVEEKVKLQDVVNYKEVLATIEQCLRKLCDPDKVAAQVGRQSHQTSPMKLSPSKQTDPDEYKLKLVEYEVIVGSAGVKQGGKTLKKSSYRVIKDDFPLIYHLDVGAMYPNIILSNRLQPSAIVTKEFCNACSYNDPINNCKRNMDWKWRGELYMATRADVRSIINEMENQKRKYNQKDRDTDEIKRVSWSELGERERIAEIHKAVREFSQKAYRRVKSSIYEDRNDTVCQRENSFYVDTVRNFRDRRYKFKRLTKAWTQKLEKAEETGDPVKTMEAKDMVLLYDSLQLAHKCILNSFYGYVMRKGARWHSMKMAGIVTFTGSNLIREAREFCEQVGLPIELDTDGIWCMLPKSFPDTYTFKLKGGKELKMPYPNCVLNYRVHQKYTNHQYQNRTETGEWKVQAENSIFFEIDGPYKSMILPASTEEDKMLKKRYAVFNFDGSIAELKGFEVKRRGELRLIQVFQTEVFPEFLKGASKEGVYELVGEMANRWLDVIESRGATMSDEEVIYFFSESKSMSKSVVASGAYKSVQITTARRLAEFLGTESMLEAEGLSCHMFIACKPYNASTTERAVPVKIFSAEYEVKKRWLQKWLQDTSLCDFDMRSIIDWNYYRERLCAVFQKLICIPAAYQHVQNPCPRVAVPEWLRKRVAEKNDKYQQRSLGMWFQKREAKNDEADTGKRKLTDLEDMAEPTKVIELPSVDFGAGPKKWLEVQRSRWALAKHSAKGGNIPGVVGKRTSLFDTNTSFSAVSKDILAMDWHVVSIETTASTRLASTLRVGDAVVAVLDEDDSEGADAEPTTVRGTITGFVGGLVRVLVEGGDEQLVRQGDVRLAPEEGLFSLWVASGADMHFHRLEVLAKRRVVIGLESEFSPEEARCEVRPSDLQKKLQVWPREPSEQRVAPGVVTTAAPDIGICSVLWSSGFSEILFHTELERQCGTAARIESDPPRNLQHGCLVELTLSENEFQRQCGEGALGDGDAAWPRVDAVYESGQPLEFDLACRIGSVTRLKATDRAQVHGRGILKLDANDLTQLPSSEYLRGLTPARNVYLHLCFDRAHPSRVFCGIFAPALSEAWVCFGGLDAAATEQMRPDLEQALAEELSQIGHGTSSPLVHTEASFVFGKSLVSIMQWLDQRLQDIRRRDGGSVIVLCSQLTTGEMRGLSPSFWVDQRQLRHLSAIRELPICRAPCPEADSEFPALDWPRYISRRFARKVPHLFVWWRTRLALCQVSGVPICNAPEMPGAVVPAALDVLYARQLRKDSQLRWASSTCRPDLGESTLALTDQQEGSLASMAWILSGKDITAGKGGGQVNNPGTHRSICLEVNLRTKLCVAALQHARYLSDREGGELSKQKVQKGTGSVLRLMDHTSEVSVSSFDSLVTLVQDIATAYEELGRNIVTFRQAWASQSLQSTMAVREAGIRLDSPADDDAAMIEALVAAGHADSQLLAKLEGMRTQYDAHGKLLDGLYGWLASETSLLYDPALLRKVQQYMDRVLQMLAQLLTKSGCELIHASYSRVLFATGKYNVLPDIRVFWESMCLNAQGMKVLEPLQLSDPACLSEVYYGMLWMDPANYAALPIDLMSGEIIWKARNSWKIAEFLPPAVRPTLVLYASDLLLGLQKEIGRRYLQHNEVAQDSVPPTNMDMDDCAAMDCDAGDDEDKEEEPVAEKAGNEESIQKPTEILNEMKTFLQGDFFDDLRRRVLAYLDDLQAEQQRELPSNFILENEESLHLMDDDGSGDSDDDEATQQRRQQRKVERYRKHLEQKWSFPEIPGRRSVPGTVEIEFMRTLIQIFQLEGMLQDEVYQLRERMCQKLRISSFGVATGAFENPCFPLVLRDVCCPWCFTASHVDVTSHPVRGPGVWVCMTCERFYDKDVIQALLVGMLDNLVQAWQSQEITCLKCRRFRSAHLATFCDCFGRYEVRFRPSDFSSVLQVMRSLVGPHDLPWLGQMIKAYDDMNP